MSASAAVLCGREGALVSVSISVDPRHLESLLEALAQVEFPINPQIYHDAALVYRFADGQHRAEAITLVEFPAYEERLGEVRRAVAAFGFDAESVHAVRMLDDIHADAVEEPAPAGAPYVARIRMKHRAVA